MTWSLQTPPETAAVDVMHVLRKQHEQMAARLEKGLPADEEDQIGAAIRAVEILRHEVSKYDADGNPTGNLHVSLNGHASKGHKKGDTITVHLSRPD